MAGRVARLERITKETQIRAEVNLDGVGKTQVDCPIGFFGHMLDALGRHAHLDLDLHIRGDLHVDQHHTVEDTAIVLGQAISKALGDKRGIWRTGSCRFPMDETLVRRTCKAPSPGIDRRASTTASPCGSLTAEPGPMLRPSRLPVQSLSPALTRTSPVQRVTLTPRTQPTSPVS